MDDTPPSYQNSSESGYFDSSRSLFESTPNKDNNSTPLLTASRKRKASFLESYNVRKLTDVIEASPMSPPFSSTFNDSLMNHLEEIHIQAEEDKIDQKGFATEKTEYASKLFKTGEHNKKKFRSAPNTPEKQTKGARDLVKRASTSSFVKTFSQFNMQSPLNKESYGILYPNLPPLEPNRKPLTPQKFRENLRKHATPTLKCMFSASHCALLKKIFSNTIIVAHIFKNLSDGDLYRLAMTSKSLQDSLRLDAKAYNRYRKYLDNHKSSKENYRITPPNSPDKEKESVVDVSPGSRNFYYFRNVASELDRTQSLVRCPQCGRPSVVQNDIGQCYDVNSCGYIFCQKCSSFAYNPRDFRDKCNRSRFGDLSNSTITSTDVTTDNASSFFVSSPSLNLSTSNKYNSSGFFSEFESNTPIQRAKRNLSMSFTSPSEIKPRALALNNNNIDTSTQPHKLKRRSSLLPVVPVERPAKTTEIVEPSSPPKVKPYTIGSKQSRRNLKRLTR